MLIHKYFQRCLLYMLRWHLPLVSNVETSERCYSYGSFPTIKFYNQNNIFFSLVRSRRYIFEPFIYPKFIPRTWIHWLRSLKLFFRCTMRCTSIPTIGPLLTIHPSLYNVIPNKSYLKNLSIVDPFYNHESKCNLLHVHMRTCSNILK